MEKWIWRENVQVFLPIKHVHVHNLSSSEFWCQDPQIFIGWSRYKARLWTNPFEKLDVSFCGGWCLITFGPDQTWGRWKLSKMLWRPFVPFARLNNLLLIFSFCALVPGQFGQPITSSWVCLLCCREMVACISFNNLPTIRKNSKKRGRWSVWANIVQS